MKGHSRAATRLFAFGLVLANQSCRRYEGDEGAAKGCSYVGYVDRTGTMVIPPAYQEGGPFRNGRACVRLEEGWAFIGTTGDRISPFFEDALDFSEGRAAVRTGGRWGFIDPSGRLIVDAVYDSADAFSDGAATVTRGGLAGAIDSMGNELISFRFRVIGPFHDGLASAQQAVGLQFGFVTRDGDFAVPPKFDAVERFSDGLAPVQVGGLWGAIDRTGRFIIEPRFAELTEFNGGFARARAPANGDWGLIDLRGEWVILPTYSSVGALADGVVPGRLRGSSSWEILTVGGGVRALTALDVYSRPSEGLMAFASDDRQIGFITTSGGEVAIPARFVRVGPHGFSEGLAAVAVRCR